MLNDKKGIYYTNLFFTYIFLLYQTITALVVHIDLRGRVVSLAIIICLLYNWKNNKLWKQLILSKPILIWGLWCLFTFLNSIIQGHRIYNDVNDSPIIWNEDIFYIQIIFRQLITMTTVCWLYIQNPPKTVKHLAIMFTITAITTFLFDTAREDWGGEVRFGSIMGNNAALMMVSFVFILTLAWTKKLFKRSYIIVGIVLAIGLILTIQTRKAFIAIIIILIFYVLAKIKAKNPITWLLLPLGIIIFFSISDYIIENTSIGSRFATIEEQAQNSNPTNIPILDLLGDRAIHVYLGWEIWLEHPICGVGLQNAPYYSHLPFIFHQEYIGQLAENGIIGFCLLIMFFYSIIKIIIGTKSINRNQTTVFICLGFMIAILFICLSAWIYQFAHYFAIFGIIIGECKNQSDKNAKDRFYWFFIRRRKRAQDGRTHQVFISNKQL